MGGWVGMCLVIFTMNTLTSSLRRLLQTWEQTLPKRVTQVVTPLTKNERLPSGLLGLFRAPKLEVVDFGPDKGRGAMAMESISKEMYVCECRTYRVYPVGSLRRLGRESADDVCSSSPTVVQERLLLVPRDGRPVQKMTQHLQKKHKLIPTTASQVAKKRRPPAEAIKLKYLHPHTRSAHQICLQNKKLSLSIGTMRVLGGCLPGLGLAGARKDGCMEP